MDTQPLVSVLTPSFNQGVYISDTLRSVSAQTYRNVEHIVMDGGSTDDTVALLEAAGPRVVWASEPDRGQTHALNKAFERSRGEIIGWLNSDDAYYDTRAIEDVVEFFARHPEVDVVYGHAARVTAEGLVVRILYVPRFNYRRLLWDCYLYQPAVFVRRRAFGSGFVNEGFQFAMDWELWLRLAQTRRFARIDRVLAIDRTHAERKIKTWLPIYEADRERLGEMYGAHSGPPVSLLIRLRAVVARLAGARFVLLQRAPLAFTAKTESKWSLLRRQIASRMSTWPEEYL
jgi:glycosyltransferase involved in cell wall biosynthesis